MILYVLKQCPGFPQRGPPCNTTGFRDGLRIISETAAQFVPLEVAEGEGVGRPNPFNSWSLFSACPPAFTAALKPPTGTCSSTVMIVSTCSANRSNLSVSSGLTVCIW